MARKFNVEASFSLTTQIEPDYIRFDESDSEDFENDSSFSMQDVECDGGRVTFVIEADDEYDAESKANEVITDGGEVEDGNGWTWLIEGLSFEIEEQEIEMDLARAREILSNLVVQAAGEEDGHEVERAVEFVFDYIAGQAARIERCVTQIDSHDRQRTEMILRISELEKRLLPEDNQDEIDRSIAEHEQALAENPDLP